MADTDEFRMPSLGADMTEGTIIEWRVGPGSMVQRGDIVALVDTDKAEIEVEVFVNGTIDELLVVPGQRVPVGTPLARLRSSTPAPSSVPAAPVLPAVAVAPAPPTPAEGVVVSPLVRHLAEEHHVDLSRARGSGPGGRVQRVDVEALIDHREARPRISPRARRLAGERGVDVSALVTGDRPVTGDDVVRTAQSAPVTAGPAAAAPVPDDRQDRRRSAIAALMSSSWREIPHYHVTTRIDLSTAVKWLAETNESRPVTERVLPAALLLKATALAAVRVPELNGWWRDDRFVASPTVELGVAVALRGGGLMTPTLADAAGLSLTELMGRLGELVGRARRGRLRSSEMAGGSLTVTNLGDLGVDAVLGIIHPPQVALVGFGAIHDEPWAADGMVGVRAVVHASLAGDHRASDGLVGARMLSAIASILQEPESL